MSESHAYSPGANGARAPVSLAVKHVMTDNPNLKTLIPHHHRVAPPASATTSADVWTALDTLGIGMPITNPA